MVERSGAFNTVLTIAVFAVPSERSGAFNTVLTIAVFAVPSERSGAFFDAAAGAIPP
jgi:hypothetical protein